MFPQRKPIQNIRKFFGIPNKLIKQNTGNASYWGLLTYKEVWGLFHKTISSWQGDSWHRPIPWHLTVTSVSYSFCKFSTEMTHCHRSFTFVTTNLGNQYFTVNQGSLNFFSALHFLVYTACFTLKFLNHVTSISDNRTMQKNRLKYD